MKSFFCSQRTYEHIIASTAILTVLTTHITATQKPESICPVPPYYSIRSQGQNEARAHAGLTNHTNISTDHAMYGTFFITPAYTRSFSPGHIAVPFFGRDVQTGNATGITGSTVETRTPKDWLADYFFFPQTFNGALTVEPRIQNLLVDFNAFWGMDAWAPGLFLRVQAPVVWSEWDLNPCPSGAFQPNNIFSTFSNLSVRAVSDFFDHFCLESAPTTTIVSIEPLCAAKICNDCGQTKAGVADVHGDLGWNVVMHDDYHFGIGARIVVPTGNRPIGKFLFEPVIGNGHHVEVGGMLDGHVTLWRSRELENYHLDLMLHADITHMCSTHHTYVFDLCNKPFSRYMLAGKITSDHTIDALAPVANLTRCTVNVSSTTQTDIVAMLTFAADYFDWNIGYNFWATGCQHVCPGTEKNSVCSHAKSSCCTDCRLAKEPWALVALPTTNPNAAVHNLGNIHEIIADDSETPLTPLNIHDIDYAAATRKGRSNKIFMHLHFNWYDHERCIPYIGTGAEIEFGARDIFGTKGNRCYARDCCSSCACCRTNAVYQWGVWVKGGFSF